MSSSNSSFPLYDFRAGVCFASLQLMPLLAPLAGLTLCPPRRPSAIDFQLLQDYQQLFVATSRALPTGEVEAQHMVQLGPLCRLTWFGRQDKHHVMYRLPPFSRAEILQWSRQSSPCVTDHATEQEGSRDSGSGGGGAFRLVQPLYSDSSEGSSEEEEGDPHDAATNPHRDRDRHHHQSMTRRYDNVTLAVQSSGHGSLVVGGSHCLEDVEAVAVYAARWLALNLKRTIQHLLDADFAASHDDLFQSALDYPLAATRGTPEEERRFFFRLDFMNGIAVPHRFPNTTAAVPLHVSNVARLLSQPINLRDVKDLLEEEDGAQAQSIVTFLWGSEAEEENGGNNNEVQLTLLPTAPRAPFLRLQVAYRSSSSSSSIGNSLPNGQAGANVVVSALLRRSGKISITSAKSMRDVERIAGLAVRLVQLSHSRNASR